MYLNAAICKDLFQCIRKFPVHIRKQPVRYFNNGHLPAKGVEYSRKLNSDHTAPKDQKASVPALI